MKSKILFSCFLSFVCAFSLLAQENKVTDEINESAQTLSPPSGKALIYVVRPSIPGIETKMMVDCNGKFIGSTFGRKFVYTLVEPGTHTLITHSPEKDHSIELEVQAGNTYYVEQRVVMGPTLAVSTLKYIPKEKKGAKKLNKCRLSKDNVLRP